MSIYNVMSYGDKCYKAGGKGTILKGLEKKIIPGRGT